MATGDGCGSPVHPLIDGDELLRRMSSGQAPRIVDVREPNEFACGHIPGAENLPLSVFLQEYHRLNPEEEIVLVCRSASRSGKAQAFLQQLGYTRVRNLVGGMLAWSGPMEYS